MGGVKSGRYSLRLAAGPSPLVGVNFDGSPISPVVTRGRDRIWIVKEVAPERYTLTVEGVDTPPLLTEGRDKNVVGRIGGPATEWYIEGPEGGPNRIQVPNNRSPPTVWTVDEPATDDYPVTLETLKGPQPPENQKWFFVRVQ